MAFLEKARSMLTPGPVAPIPEIGARPPARHFREVSEAMEASGAIYTDFFAFLNRELKPNSYFEIGTQKGVSASSFGCDAVCVDPHFIIDNDLISLRREIHFFQMP